jgi:hypothetical protein
MSGLQWIFVIGAGIAGYVGVAWLIDRGRRANTPPPAAPTRTAADAASRQAETPAPPPLQTGGERSAWDEFNRP